MNKPSPFRFQHFNVQQDERVMKVGTDAILLGSWIASKEPQRVLDVGTGCGVIVMMLAQRFAKAEITAIDVNPIAAQLAQANFTACKWADRMKALQTSLQEFEHSERFDLIVSNPPFFSSGPPSPNHDRKIARHEDTLTLPQLVADAAKRLTDSGALAVVVPTDRVRALIEVGQQNGLFPAEHCDVLPMPKRPAKRSLLRFVRQLNPPPLSRSEFPVEIRRHEYSAEYADLARDFLLRYAHEKTTAADSSRRSS